jgi:6-phosphogluconolactonase
MPTEYRFDSADAAAQDLARHIASTLSDAIAARGVATIALSGGRSPRAVLEALREMPLDWAKVIVAQVDERWVDPSHADSNERLIREALLTGPAAAARLVPMKNDADDAYQGQAACEEAMAALPWPIDIMLLGMGEDGHTASLFPEADELHDGLTTQALTLAVTPPAAPHQRLSLSLRENQGQPSHDSALYAPDERHGRALQWPHRQRGARHQCCWPRRSRNPADRL